MYKELIKALKGCAQNEKICDKCRYKGRFDCIGVILSDAADAIEQLLEHIEVQSDFMDVPFCDLKERRWTSMEDGLPKLKSGDEGYTGYLVYSNGYIQVADYTGDKLCDTPWFHVDGEYETGVTHWMPLPGLPQNNETETDYERSKEN